MRVAIIAAVAENGVIGRDGGLPWRLSGDLRRFRALTIGKPVVMGRKTYQSIGRPLPGRRNIVITRNSARLSGAVEAAPDLRAALDRAAIAAAELGADEVFVIGGAAVYREALTMADIIHMTEVHATAEGAVTFPLPLDAEWREVSRERRSAGDGDDHDYSFVTFERTPT